ncbi:Exportin-4 [Nymphon striatum]|nr:Exportin-4 [Nymphon striatum]
MIKKNVHKKCNFNENVICQIMGGIMKLLIILLFFFISETCQNDFILFQTVTLLKKALVREWDTLAPSDIESIINFLMQYIMKATNLKSFVREQVTFVLAMMVKRSSCNVHYQMNNLLEEVSQFIKSQDVNLQHIGCSLLSALLNEYALSVQSSNLHMPLGTHLKVKKLFENGDMKKIFEFCLQALSEIARLDNLSPELMLLTQKILSIFIFRPPPTWKDIFCKPEFCQVFFKLHRKTRMNQEVNHVNLQCLIQQSTLCGMIFTLEKKSLQTKFSQVEFFSQFVQSFLECITSNEILDHEALPIANIFHKLTQSSRNFTDFAENVKYAFFKKMSEITCYLASKASVEENIQKDDQIFMEAFETILEAWSPFVHDEIPIDCVTEHVIEIFNCFVKCHLSPPDGSHSEIVDGDCEEIDEIEEDDRLKFKGQLSVISHFGRRAPNHSLPLIFRLIEERTSRLHGQLQRISHQGSGMNISDTTYMTMLYEDLHWLVMIAGFVLMNEAEGETALIPRAINQHSLEQSSSNVDLNVTLQILGSPGQKISDIPGSDSSDHVVRLISAIFRICEFERCALEANLVGYLSPQVAATLMWFLKTWTTSYLLPSEKLYTTISPTLLSAFGRDTEAGAWIVNFILNKICSNLSRWNSESHLMDETISCLITLVSCEERATKVVKSDFWNAVREIESSDQVSSLQTSAKRGLFKALVLAASNCRENSENYLTQVFRPLQEKFSSVVSKQDFNTIHKEESVKLVVINFIESLIGFADGCKIYNIDKIFPYLLPVLKDLLTLFELYHNYNQIVKLILEFYRSIILKLFCFVNEGENRDLYENCYQMIQIYVKHNKGKKTIEVNADEENFEDLRIMLIILLELITKEYLDFAPVDEHSNSSNRISISELALFGLSSLMPLMTYELLKAC